MYNFIKHKSTHISELLFGGPYGPNFGFFRKIIP